MGKRKVEKQDRFSLDIYRKKDNRACVVFRKNRMLYRISNIESCSRLLADLKALADLGGTARLIELRNPRNRKWVVEVSDDHRGHHF